jgi:hypothetical protein
MEGDATIKVVYNFIDRDKRKGSTSIRLPFSITIATALSYAISLSGPISGISDAVLVGIDIIYRASDPDAITPLSGSTVDTKVSLFYREGEKIEAITIPAAKEELFETEGPYTAIRVDLLSDEMVTWMDYWADISGDITTAEGEAFPEEYLTGGKLL